MHNHIILINSNFDLTLTILYCMLAYRLSFHISTFSLQVDAAGALSQFYYPPVAAVSVSYPKEAIRTECLIDGELKGFGQLHPRSQGVETLGNTMLYFHFIKNKRHQTILKALF